MRKNERTTDEVVIALRSLKKGFVRVGLGRVLASEPARRVRKLLFHMPLAAVLEVAETLENGGVDWWLAGGWGVDGLLGKQTRRHEDVDICIDVADDGERRAIHLLGDLGYEVVQRRARSGRYLPVRCVLRNAAGRAIDLLMVQLPPNDAQSDPRTGWPIPVLTERDTTIGLIGEHQLPILSVAAQLHARSVYPPGRREYVDVARLCRAYGCQPPEGYHSRQRRIIDKARRQLGRLRTSSAIVISVPEARQVLNSLGGKSTGLPPHITVLFPFKKPRRLDQSDARKLTHLANSLASPVRFDFDEVGQFDGLMYLSPNPPDCLVQLIELAAELWPDNPPYGGEFKEIIPHLTLGVRDLSPNEVDDLARTLPLSASVRSLDVYVRSYRGRWSRRERFLLGAG